MSVWLLLTQRGGRDSVRVLPSLARPHRAQPTVHAAGDILTGVASEQDLFLASTYSWVFEGVFCIFQSITERTVRLLILETLA